MNHLFIYTTFPDRAAAEAVSRVLVEEGLIACANILAPHTAIYRWEGAVQQEEEVAVIMKTTSDRYEALQERYVALHPYEVPCFVALDIKAGFPPYLEWLKE